MTAKALGEGRLQRGLELRDWGFRCLEYKIAGGDQRARRLEAQIQGHCPQIRHQDPSLCSEDNAVEQGDIAAHAARPNKGSRIGVESRKHPLMSNASQYSPTSG